MVNIIIYVKREFSAEDLVSLLLSKELIASASIDENNISYVMHDGVIHKESYNIITAKSKGLLLDQIINAVEEKIGAEVLIIAIPIVGSNKFFFELVSENTMRI